MNKWSKTAGRVLVLLLVMVLTGSAMNTASAGWITVTQRRKLLQERESAIGLHADLYELLGEPTVMKAQYGDAVEGLRFEEVTLQETLAALEMLTDETVRAKAGIEDVEYSLKEQTLTLFGTTPEWEAWVLISEEDTEESAFRKLQWLREQRMQRRNGAQ